MKKKVLAVLTALLLIVSVLPTSSALAISEDEFTVDAIKAAGIKDPGFAQAVHDTIVADTSFDLSSYSSVQAALAAYTGTIVVSGMDSYDIDGVELMPNSWIQFPGLYVEDASPINPTGNESIVRRSTVDLNGNPIHIWPTVVPDITTGKMFAIQTKVESAGKALYVNDGSTKTQTVDFDVHYKKNGSLIDPTWNLGQCPHTYDEGGKVVSAGAPTVNSTSESFNVSGKGYFYIKMTLESLLYDTDKGGLAETEQKITPGYYYRVDSDYYDLLYVKYNLNNTVGFNLVKYKEGTTTPVAGAEYGVYSDPQCTTLVKTVTTDTRPVKVDGLKPATYYVKEITAPDNYNLSDKITTVDLTGGTHSVDAQGTKELSNITPNTSTWSPVWSSFNSDAETCTLNYKESPLTANVSDYQDAVLFIGGPTGDVKTVSKFQLGLAEGETFTGTWGYSYVDADGRTVTKDGGDYTGGDLAGDLNTIISDGHGNLTVTFTGTITGSDAKYKTVEVIDTPVTIWVENTTGSSYGTPKYKENAGGEVYICGRQTFDDPEASIVEGTRSNVSSDGADDNSNNRKENYCACGKAYEGWFVQTDKILIGARDARDNGGAGYVNIGKKGPFSVELTDKAGNKHTVTGIVDWNDDMTQACVFIDPETFTLDIDIAIPFYTNEPVPETGEAGMIIVWSMIALAMVYAMVSLKKNRKEAR